MKKLLFLLFLIPCKSWALSSLLFPQSASSLAGANNAWITPTNVEVEDGIVSTTTIGVASPSNFLAATNFGFNIPNGSQIVGILAEIKKMNVDNIVQDKSIILYNADGSSTSSDKASGTAWPVSLAWISYGGATDTWGKSWMASDINSSGFGLGIQAQSGSFSINANIDAIRITIYYSLNGTTIYNGTIFNGTLH